MTISPSRPTPVVATAYSSVLMGHLMFADTCRSHVTTLRIVKASDVRDVHVIVFVIVP